MSGRLDEALSSFEALVKAGFSGAVKGVERCQRLLRKRAEGN
jgi:hypothetical protein